MAEYSLDINFWNDDIVKYTSKYNFKQKTSYLDCIKSARMSKDAFPGYVLILKVDL